MCEARAEPGWLLETPRGVEKGKFPTCLGLFRGNKIEDHFPEGMVGAYPTQWHPLSA